MRHETVLIFFILLLAAHSAFAAEAKTEVDPAVQALADKQWTRTMHEGEKPGVIRPELSALASDRMKRVLPGWSVYRAHVFNPMAVIAGRPTFIYALALKDGKPTYLEDDASAAQFLTEQKIKPGDPGEALNLVLVFAELRGYVLQMPSRTQDADEWRLVMEENKDGWIVQCTFVTDPNISRCRRYAITVGRDGAVSVVAGKVVQIGGGYR